MCVTFSLIEFHMYDAISETLPNVLSLQIIHVVRKTLFVFRCCYFLCYLFFVVVLRERGRDGYATTERTNQQI